MCSCVWWGDGSVIFAWHFSASALLEERRKDAGRWRVLAGVSLPCAHTTAPNRPSSKRSQDGSLGHTSFVQAARLTFHTRRWITAQVCSDIINLGSGVTFLGQISFYGDSGEPVRCPHKVVFNSLFQKKTVCKEKVAGIVVGQLVFGTSCPV